MPTIKLHINGLTHRDIAERREDFVAKAVGRTIVLRPAPMSFDAQTLEAFVGADCVGVRMGSRFFREIHDMQPLKLIKSYRGPVFIIQGDKDAIVSMEDSKKAVTLYKDASLYIIPGAGHGFNPRERAESIGKIKTFIMWGNGGGIPY